MSVANHACLDSEVQKFSCSMMQLFLPFFWKVNDDCNIQSFDISPVTSYFSALAIQWSFYSELWMKYVCLSYPRCIPVYPWCNSYWPGIQAFCAAMYQHFLKTMYILSMLSCAFVPFSHAHAHIHTHIETSALLNMNFSAHFEPLHLNIILHSGGRGGILWPWIFISSIVL